MKDDGIHIAVDPLGAIGGALTASLVLAPGDHITIVSRRHSGLVNEFGVGSFGETPSHWRAGTDLSAHCSLSEIDKPIDWLLLPAPAYAMEQIASDISACSAITEKTFGLVISNGWLNRNPFEKVIASHRLYHAANMVGCLRRSPNVFEITVNGGIMIGSLTGAPLDAAQGLASALSAGGLASRLTEQIGPEIFRKLSLNNLGSLSALHRMPLGGLLQPEFTSSVRRIAIETWRASIDVGHRSFETETAAVEDAYSRIRKAAKHTASITKAICNRERTENDAFCGAIVRISRENGWFAEECAHVWQEIRAAEERDSARGVAITRPELAGAAR